MRAAALHLAFAGLGANDAVSGAFADNVSSLRVSEKLGYQADGIERLAAQGQVTITHRLRLTRERWETADQVPVTITGLEPCLPLFGLRMSGGRSAVRDNGRLWTSARKNGAARARR